MGAHESDAKGILDTSSLIADLTQINKILSTVTRNLKKYDKKKIESLEDLKRAKNTIMEIENKLNNLQDGKLKRKLEKWITDERTQIESIDQKLHSGFAMELYNLLNLNEMKLEGHMPKLKTSFYNMDIDFSKNTCKLSYGQDKDQITTLKINPKEISEYIIKHRNKLENQFDNATTFQKHLFQAYTNVNKRSGRNGGKAPIIEVLLEISILKQGRSFRINPSKSNFTPYGRVQFSYDLYRLSEIHPEDIQIKISIATRAQARNRAQYLWIPKNIRGEGSIYSHIELVRR